MENKMKTISSNSKISQAILNLELKKFEATIDLRKLHSIIVDLEEFVEITGEIDASYSIPINESVECSDPFGVLMGVAKKLQNIADELRFLPEESR
jgi:hypothetical protein